MKIPKRILAALSAMSVLSRHAGRWINVTDLCEQAQISLKEAHMVMPSLCTAGLVESQRGPGGGYRLAGPPSDISVLRIFEAVDGPVFPVKVDAPECIKFVGCNLQVIVGAWCNAMTMDKVSMAS